MLFLKVCVSENKVAIWRTQDVNTTSTTQSKAAPPKGHRFGGIPKSHWDPGERVKPHRWFPGSQWYLGTLSDLQTLHGLQVRGGFLRQSYALLVVSRQLPSSGRHLRADQRRRTRGGRSGQSWTTLWWVEICWVLESEWLWWQKPQPTQSLSSFPKHNFSFLLAHWTLKYSSCFVLCIFSSQLGCISASATFTP